MAGRNYFTCTGLAFLARELAREDIRRVGAITIEARTGRPAGKTTGGVLRPLLRECLATLSKRLGTVRDARTIVVGDAMSVTGYLPGGGILRFFGHCTREKETACDVEIVTDKRTLLVKPGNNLLRASGV